MRDKANPYPPQSEDAGPPRLCRQTGRVVTLDDEASSLVQLVERDDLWRRGIAPEQLEGSVFLFVDPVFAYELFKAADNYERLGHVVVRLLASRISIVVSPRELPQLLRSLSYRSLHLGNRSGQLA